MDELLIKKAIKGDKDSFSNAILEIKNEAYRIAYCYLQNEEDSMDAVCDAVEKSLLNIKKLKEAKFFKTWFIRIVINECKSQLRKKKQVIALADNLYPENTCYAINQVEKMDLVKLLNILEPSERSLIFMKYYLGYTLEEIAGTVDLPVGTVKSKIYRNLKLLREKIACEEGIYES